jgi:hypothetical protein
MINKVSFRDAVERALDWLTSGQPVNHVLIDDQDDDEEKDIGKSISSSAIEQISAFYRQWTKNSISEEDHRAMAEIAQIDLNCDQARHPYRHPPKGIHSQEDIKD